MTSSPLVLSLFFAVVSNVAGAQGGASTAENMSASVTYAEHIAPILDKNCVPCHREGENAPFAFTTYELASRRAKLIAYMTESREMPPWKAVRGHQEYANERGLTDAQIDRIRAWVDQGAPEGDPAKRPTPPVFSSGWRLGKPDVVVQMSEPFEVPADGPDIYVHFVLDLPEAVNRKWLRGVEYRSHAPLVAHHTLFMLDRTGEARALDAETEEPGFEEMSTPSQLLAGGSPYFDTWAVGNQPYPYPEGAGITLDDGTDLVLQCHFHPGGKVVSEQAEVGLYLTDEAPRYALDNVPVPYGFGFGIGIDVPPGAANYEISDSYTLPVDCSVFSLMPHAHYICKEMKCVAELPSGEKLTLVEIDNWDFAWQEKYQLTEPIRLPKGTVVRNSFVYDNSSDNPDNPYDPPQRIRFGPDSTDEMASIALRVILDSEDVAHELRLGLRGYARETILNADMDLLWEGIEDRIIARYDKDGDNALNQEEKTAAAARMRERFVGGAGGSGGLSGIEDLSPEDRMAGMRLISEIARRFMAL